MLRRAVVGLCRWNASLEGSCPKWMSSAVAPLHEPHLDAQPVTLPSIEAAFHDRQISAQKETRRRANGIPLTTGRRRLVVLGTGWAACRLLRDIDPRKYDLTVVSPRNHMVFTPLLASTTVGTLDPRSVTLHIAMIQKALHQPQNQYHMASCENVDVEEQLVHCNARGVQFSLRYDKLAICTGSQGSTFGIPGVEKYTHFLRDVRQATEIRRKLIENIGLAPLPGNTAEEFSRYLTVAIVGGGPTGVEFAGELCDFVREDLKRLYPNRARAIRVILIEAQEVLGSFDTSLREYAAQKLTRQGVHLVKGTVQEVGPSFIRLKDGRVIHFGLCVWSTGVGPTDFISSLSMSKTEYGRLAIDDYMRVLKLSTDDDDTSHQNETSKTRPIPNVYALGDCCANRSRPLPALAQVAEQQGKYLAKILNAEISPNGKEIKMKVDPFVYRHLGSMATVGRMSAIMQLDGPRFSLAGFSSWVAWRSAYLTRLGTVRNRLYVAFNWTITLLFGRDLSRW